MRSAYEIRTPSLGGIYIGFDTEREAMTYWRETIEGLPESDTRHGAVVALHQWEDAFEAERARLDFLLTPQGHQLFARACLEGGEVPPASDVEAWRKFARAAIDRARGAPGRVVTQIWPKPRT